MKLYDRRVLHNDTNEEKRKRVKHLLIEHLDWREWSDNEISKACCVSPPLVAKIKKQLSKEFGIIFPTLRMCYDARITARECQCCDKETA